MKCVLFLGALLLASPLAHATGGTDVGRGGDSIALDFRSVANYDLALLRQNAAALDPAVDLNALERVIVGARLSTEEQVFLEGVEKDAVNYSKPDRIVISASRWRSLPLNDPRKDALVLHEYVSLLGLDDSGYAISGRLLQTLRSLRNRAGAGLPVYACVLIKDPRMDPQYLDSARVGGPGESDLAGLGAERMRVQLFFANGGHGTEVLIIMKDGARDAGQLELPHVNEFPPEINVYGPDRDAVLWQVHCSR